MNDLSLDDNSCAFCELGQECCSHLGLKLTPQEFENYFRIDADRYKFTQYGKMTIVYSKDNKPCRYWDNNKCTIYNERPIDCRIYPYELFRITLSGQIIDIVIFDKTSCLNRENIFIPLHDVVNMVKKMAQETYGYDKKIRFKIFLGEETNKKTIVSFINTFNFFKKIIKPIN